MFYKGAFVMAESKNIFAERLEKLIKENNYTHENVAKGIDVTRQAVGKWVKGDSVPDVLTSAKLAKFFEVSVDYLAGISPHRTSDKDLSAVCEYTGLTAEAIENLSNRIGNNCALIKKSNTEYLVSHSPFKADKDSVSLIISSDEFWNIIYYLFYLKWTTQGYSSNIVNVMLNTPPNEWREEDKMIMDTVTYADVYRYNIVQEIEKISDMFDKREDENNANHNPKKE